MVVIVLSLVMATIINLMLTALIYYHQKGRIANYYFSVFLFFAALWALGDVLMLFAKDRALVQVGLYLFLLAPMITTHFVLLFSEVFPAGEKIGKLKHYLYALPTIALWITIAVNVDWVSTITITPTGEQNILVAQKPGFVVYSLFFNVYFLLVYINMIRNYRRSTGIAKAQIFYSMMGIILTSFLAVTTNTAFPNFLENSDFVWLGPVFTLILSSLTSYAILKHQLFDPRLVVVRFFSYIMSMAAIGALTILLAFLIVSSLFEIDLSTNDYIAYVIFTTIIFVLSPYLRRQFDNLTTRIFYQDKYQERHVRDSLAIVIKSYTDIQELVVHSLEVISANIKTRHAQIVVFGHNGKLHRFSEGDVKKPVGQALLKTSELNSLEAIITDETKLPQQLKKRLREAEIDLVLTIYDAAEPTGYLLLGPKKNGTVYYSDDINLLKDVRDSLGLAIANAKKFEQLEQFNVQLQREVTKATAELKDANQKLVEADNAKTEFMSMTSHQLKPQLTATKGFISMLEDGAEGPLNEKQLELAKLSSQSVNRMVDIVTSLLDMPRRGFKSIKLSKKTADFKEIVAEEIKRKTTAAEKRDIKLKLTAPKKLPIISLDKAKIGEVVANIITNAITYSPEGSQIKVFIKKTADELIFEVHDKGIGVPKDEEDRLFTKYYRSKQAAKVRPTGTGVGLFYVSRVINAHGGEMVYRARSKGSVFGFKVPL